MKHIFGIRPRLSYFLLALSWTSASAAAAIDIAQQPLETGSTVEPNIMFLLDDSGSMRFGFMPDELDSDFRVTYSEYRNRRWYKYLYDDCIEAISYASAKVNVCTAKDRRFLASNQLNKLYFNPNTTYDIPMQPDGKTPYPTPKFTSAPHNGYDLNASKIDLSKNYLALMDDFYYGLNEDEGFAISRSSANVNQSAAFYFNYNGSSGCTTSSRQDSCYTLVDVGTASDAIKLKFAIWYSFYRTRLMVAKAGVTAAFLQQESGIRVGYGAINLNPVVAKDVARFSKNDANGQKKAFFSWLQGKQAKGGTPLHTALDAAGDYYKTSDVPWQSDTGSSLLECRQSYTILMTDGYYSSTKDVGNQDNTNGKTIVGPLIPGREQKSYTYTPSGPFKDDVSATLADVAMKYWKEDLRTDLPNSVPTSDPSFNPAFWQHMVTFGVGLGVVGSVNAATAFAAIPRKGSINWPSTDSNSGKIDDLLHAAVNSRGGFFSAGDTTAFVNGLASTLKSITGRVASASNIAATALNSLQTESNLYQARFTAGNWTGDLYAYDVNNLSTPLWKASEKVPLPAARNIWVGDPDADTISARSFTWNQLTANEQKALGNNPALVDYLRGDRTNEKPAGDYRARQSVLGDFVNSSPVLVGEPLDLSYHRYSWAGADSYRTFVTGAMASRRKALYVGGNDGMLHGFFADTGVESFAYIPRTVMVPQLGDTLNFLHKYADPNYLHQFSVDGTPVVADVFISRANESTPKWRSVLVGGLGRGGAGMFAVDVTDPTSLSGNSVLWDKKNQGDYALMGTFIGKPVIARLNNGQWGIIVGYGYNNSSHAAGLLIFDIATGQTIANLKTTAGTASNPNAMSELNAIDLNADGNVDYIYGGDLLGNVWKFDVSASQSSQWAIAYSGKPLFTAKDKQGAVQMITGGVLATQEPKTGKVWLFFGTGRYLNIDDPSSTQSQSWYGLIDQSLIKDRTELSERLVTNVDSSRVISEVTALEDNKKGWYIDLIDTRERIVDIPVMVGHELVMNTVIPDTNVCNPSGSGYVMAVEPYSGSGLKYNYFDINNDGAFDDKDSVSINTKKVTSDGIKVSSLNSVVTYVRTPNSATADKPTGTIKAVTNCGAAELCATNVQPKINLGMQSWREIN
jgi:type IV pilus assembly protein PilY1